MTPGDYKPINQCPVLKFDHPHRYLDYPQATSTGIVDYELEVGARFKKGDLLATIRHMNGTVSSLVTADIDGYVLAWEQGIAVYDRAPLGFVAIFDGNISTVMDWNKLPK